MSVKLYKTEEGETKEILVEPHELSDYLANGYSLTEQPVKKQRRAKIKSSD